MRSMALPRPGPWLECVCLCGGEGAKACREAGWCGGEAQPVCSHSALDTLVHGE